MPLRPGGVDGSPFWNIHSTRFTYAPAFDFSVVDGAVTYRFRVTHENGEEYVFEAKSPVESLSSVWNDVAPGNVTLIVEGLDAEGKVLPVRGGSSGHIRLSQMKKFPHVDIERLL